MSYVLDITRTDDAGAPTSHHQEDMGACTDVILILRYASQEYGHIESFDLSGDEPVWTLRHPGGARYELRLLVDENAGRVAA